MNSRLQIVLAGMLLATIQTGLGQPGITAHPTNWPAVCLGVSLTNRVVAYSPVTLAYQWCLNGAPLPGQTKNLIILTNVQLRDAGDYTAVATDLTGSITSRVVKLTVNATFTKIIQGPLVEDREPSVSGAWGDYDNDGRLDLFVANRRSTTYPDRLYRNLGGGEFVRVTNALASLSTLDSWGAQWGDVDNDGDLDILVVGHAVSGLTYPQNGGRNELFRNDGGGVFTRMTNAVTSVVSFWNDATWVDLNGDGWLDLFATTDNKSVGPSPNDFFWQNLANGEFAAWTTNDVGVVLKPRRDTAGPAWCDIDGDGDLDLYVASPYARTNFLYRNNSGRLIPVKAGSLPAASATYAATWADFNNDGLFDLFTAGDNGTNTFHLNRGNWVFEDVTVASGVASTGTVYNLTVGDYNNDGNVDLYVPVYDGPDVLYVNRGDATFDRAKVGCPLTEGFHNTATWVDYDNDGFLDLFEPCGDLDPALNLLYRNSLPQSGNSNHWLKLCLKGTVSNASAIGARVWVRAIIGGKDTWQVRQVTSACLSSAPTDGMRVHFGLGDATSVTTARIEWPSGNVQEVNVGINQINTVTESAFITPARPSASLNGSATLTRIAIAGASYQWRLDGVDLAGQTNWILNLTNITADMAGCYSVVVSNAIFLATNFVYLIVDTTFTKITQGPVVEDLESSAGAAWGDYDNDGWLDLFVPNNGPTYRSTLYRNLGGDQFVRVSNALTTATSRPTWGAQWMDVDNDGDLDMFILRPFSADLLNGARNEMFRNDGGGVFTPINNAATAGAALWTDATWVDHDRDGWLDLFATTQSWTAGQSNDDFFWRNRGDGRFVPWNTNDVGVVLRPGSKTAGPAWCDIDGDGDLDLYVSKYEGLTNFLYRNDNGRLIPVTAGSLPAKRSTWAAAWADFNNDGLFDLFTAGENGTNMLHLNRGSWVFEDATVACGLALAGNVFNTAVGDFDNDGDVDLYVPVYDAADVLYVNRGNGTFDRAKVGSLLTEGFQKVGARWVDYDNDGFLDLFKPCGYGTPALNFLYRNSLPQHGNTNHWLKLRLKGTASNASAIGARIWARAAIGGKDTWQVRQITSACMAAVDTDGMRVHFGLGNATSVATLRIEWPSGMVQELNNVATKQILTITEPRRPVLTLQATPAGFTGVLKADANLTYQVQASDDLTAGWTVLTTVTTDASGLAYWSDPATAPQGRRFYKAFKPPAP